jgi:hypothetical protein
MTGTIVPTNNVFKNNKTVVVGEDQKCGKLKAGTGT